MRITLLHNTTEMQNAGIESGNDVFQNQETEPEMTHSEPGNGIGNDAF